MKIMKGTGDLLTQLEYNTQRIHGAHISIPLLAVEEHISKTLTLERIPAGIYDAIVTLYLTTGGETKRNVKIKVLPDQTNTVRLNFMNIAGEIILKPVDSKNRTVLFSEIKIENVDSNFRLVRDEKGLPCKVPPGKYQVKMVLPDMRVITMPLIVKEDQLVYTLQVDTPESTRAEPRFHLSVPVYFKTPDGNWTPTRSTNISSTGICLVKGSHKITNTKLYLRLFVPFSHTPVECQAEVRWTRDDRLPSHSQMGLHLKLPEDIKASLARWLNRESKPST